MAKTHEGSIDELITDNLNFNKGTEYGQHLLQNSVDKFGLGRSVLVDKNNRLIAGNKTTERAVDSGFKKAIFVETDGTELVVVKRKDVDLDSARGREMAMADNAVAIADIEWDNDNLREAAETYNIDPTEWGIPEIEDPEEPEPDVREDDFTPPETGTIKTSIKRGDIFEIKKEGELCHRIMCGDATDPNDVLKLMGGNKIDLIVTDPPYNVDYASKNEVLNLVDKGNHNQENIANDMLSNAEFSAFLKKVYANYSANAKAGCPIYVFHASREAVNFIKGMTGAGFLYKQQLIWVKNNIVLSRQDYQWQHEPILYGWKDGGPHYFIKERTHRTVIEDNIDLKKLSKKELIDYIRQMQNDNESTIVYEDKPQVSEEHPTMKPVRLLARFIRNSSHFKENVADFFLGSGSTLIAAHQLRRNCYGMELKPEYVQVIINRLKKFDPLIEIREVKK